MLEVAHLIAFLNRVVGLLGGAQAFFGQEDHLQDRGLIIVKRRLHFAFHLQPHILRIDRAVGIHFLGAGHRELREITVKQSPA